MATFSPDNEDPRWYIEQGIDWESLVRTTEADFRNPGGPKSVDEALAFYKETLELVGGFASDEIAPHAAQLDREGVRHEGGEAVFPERLAGIFDQVKQLGLHGLCVPRELGGMNAPVMLFFLAPELFGRADVSVMAHHGSHGGMAPAFLDNSTAFVSCLPIDNSTVPTRNVWSGLSVASITRSPGTCRSRPYEP